MILNGLMCLLRSYTSKTEIPVYMALKQNNIDILKNKLQDISNPLSSEYGKFMTKNEINNIINPSKLNQLQTINWLSKYKINNIQNFGDTIKFTTEPEELSVMFNRRLTDGRQEYTIPNDLSHIVDFIEMYSKPISKNFKKNIKSKNNIVDDRFFGRESLLRVYNITRPSILHHGSAAAIEYQNNAGFTQEDITQQENDNGQDSNIVGPIIGVNYGTDAESELDVQMISEAGDSINIQYLDSPYWLYSFAVDFYNSQDTPDIISMSWGWSEDSQCDIIDCNNITSKQYVNRVNNEYIKMGLSGTTITASSGDAGAPGRTGESCDPNRPINPVFPGSSPYVLSIGATFITKENNKLNFNTTLCKNSNCVEGLKENTISFNDTEWTAGGGFNIYSDTPLWQKKFVRQYLSSNVTLPNSSNFNSNGRAYPDISAIGHSCPTYIDGNLQKIDGTSCSSPIIAGLLGIINDFIWEKYRTKLGFVNPLLYYIFDNCDNCFNLINNGSNWCTEETCCDSNYGFNGVKGFDPVTGLGSLNIGNILEFLNNNNFFI